jgi:hypothetical protein
MATLVTGAGLIGTDFAAEAHKRGEAIVFVDPEPRADRVVQHVQEAARSLVLKLEIVKIEIENELDSTLPRWCDRESARLARQQRRRHGTRNGTTRAPGAAPRTPRLSHQVEGRTARGST